ncbi:MAG: carbohydrate ABC transporter permease [Clostridia bacterium]|nr:carbohydrate ABC transporter permease [Clostridia bacterium]
MKKTFGEKLFDTCNILFMLLIAFVSIYPLWYVLVGSFSSGDAVSRGEVAWWIKEFTTDAYVGILELGIGTAYANTIFYTLVGTALNLVLTILGAYVLSKKRLRGRSIFNKLILLSMWFTAGTIPTYLGFKNLGLLNTRLAVILCGAVATYYVILMRTYFESIPDAMEEAAKIDGASDFRILTQVYLPLSTASLVTIGLYYFVQRWNAYFWAMLLLQQAEEKMPLQVLLKKLVVEQSTNDSTAAAIDYNSVSRETTIFATIVVSTLPMIVLYPFIQKFFVKGVMVGAVKG